LNHTRVRFKLPDQTKRNPCTSDPFLELKTEDALHGFNEHNAWDSPYITQTSTVSQTKVLKN